VHFIETLITGCDVRTYLSEPDGDLAFGDMEAFATGGCEDLASYAIDPCSRWLFFIEVRHESADIFLAALNFDIDAVGGVTNEAVESEVCSQTVNKRTKANPLNDPLNA
jgi:hypothetical protein